MLNALIISCSQRKRLQEGPAVMLYDGGLFKIVRRCRPRVDLFILSAKYGLISATQGIEAYDLRIDQQDQRSFQILALAQWLELDMCNYSHIYTCMSKVYAKALAPVANILLTDTQASTHLGLGVMGIGHMQARLATFCCKTAQTFEGPDPAWWSVLDAK